MARQKPTAFTSIDPPRNFTLTTEERIRGLAGDIPAYALRKRRIEDEDDDNVTLLVAAYDASRARGEGDEAAWEAVRRRAFRIDLAKVNALVAKHNRWFPIEANLPIDYRTGGYLQLGRPWAPEQPRTVAWLMAQAMQALENRSRFDGT